MAAAPVWVSDDLATAREHVRWFPALVSNHVMDLIARYDPAELPPELTAYVHDRDGYDYHHHAEVGSDNAQFVSDDVVDRFCIVGPVEEHQRRLRELADARRHTVQHLPDERRRRGDARRVRARDRAGVHEWPTKRRSRQGDKPRARR